MLCSLNLEQKVTPRTTSEIMMRVGDIPRFKAPKRAPHVEEFIKKINTLAAKDLITRYEAQREKRNKIGQEKLSVGAQIKTAQACKMSVEKKIAALEEKEKADGKVLLKMGSWTASIQAAFPAKVQALILGKKEVLQEKKESKSDSNMTICWRKTRY